MQFSYLKLFLFLTVIESSVPIISYFCSFFLMPVNFASLVYKLCFTFQTRQDTRTLFILECI